MSKVLITTKHRGVFAGEEIIHESDDGRTITLANARNCVTWSGLKGVFALASEGPNDECRIGVKVASIKLFDVTSVTPITEQAWLKWEEAPWS